MNTVPTFIELKTLYSETANEFFFQLICYHIMLFTGLVWDPLINSYIGVSLLSCVFLLLGVNMGAILYIGLKKFIFSRKIKRLAKIRARIIRERDEAIHLLRASN